MRLNGSIKCLSCGKQSPFMVKTHDAPKVELTTTCLRCGQKHVITVLIANYKEDITDATVKHQNVSPADTGGNPEDSKQPPVSSSAVDDKEEEDDLKKLFDDILDEAGE